MMCRPALDLSATMGAWALFAAVCSGGTASFTVDVNVTNGLIRPLLGINTGPFAADTNNCVHIEGPYKDIGVTEVRTHDFYGPVDMCEMYPDTEADPDDPGSYNFTNSDERMAHIHNNGHTVFLRIGNSYNYGEYPYFAAPPSNTAHWIEASKNVIRHYTEGLWNGFFYPVQRVEIWNEPDNPQFWGGTKAQFFDLYEQTALALRSSFPNLLIGGPGLAPSSYLADTNYPIDFLSYCKDHSVPLDFFSWHLYSDSPSDFENAARFYRGLLNANGFTNTENCISEWHIQSDALRTNALGAAILAASWIGLQLADVERSHLFRGQDPTNNFDIFYGLFRADGSYKKPAYVFKAWSMMARQGFRLASSGSHTGVAFLAARSADAKSVAALIVNYGTSDPGLSATNYDLTLLHDGYPDMWNIQRHVISGTNNLDTVESGTADLGLPISRALPPKTIELLLLDNPSVAFTSSITAIWRDEARDPSFVRLLGADQDSRTNLLDLHLDGSSGFACLIATSGIANRTLVGMTATLSNDVIWAPSTGSPYTLVLAHVPGRLQEEGPVYDFFMGRYEIRNDEFIEFLNDAEANPATLRGANTLINRTGDTNSWGDVYMGAAKISAQLMFDCSMSRVAYFADRPAGQRFAVSPEGPTGGGSYSNHPVTGVTWYGAAKFCNWLTLSRGFGSGARCYHEGATPDAWYPATLPSCADFTNNFSATEREAWRTNALMRSGFRLPMTGLAPAANPYNEFFRAAALGPDIANMRYAWGRNSLSSSDANYAASSDPFDGGTTPVGYFDGIQILTGGGLTQPNENACRIYDLGGNVEEWSNDPYPGAFDLRRVFGGHYLSTTNELDLFHVTNAPPDEATATRGFRIVLSPNP